MNGDKSMDRTKAEERLDPAECLERLKFETLLVELSARFINLPAEQVDDAIVDAQRRICDCVGLDVVVLWQWEADAPGVFTLTHHYRRREGPPLTRQLPVAEAFPWGLREVQAGRSYFFPPWTTCRPAPNAIGIRCAISGRGTPWSCRWPSAAARRSGPSASTTWPRRAFGRTCWSSVSDWRRRFSPTPWRAGDTKRRCRIARTGWPWRRTRPESGCGAWIWPPGAIGRRPRPRRRSDSVPRTRSRWSAFWRRSCPKIGP